jgi:subtilisin family serine protease
MINEDIMSDEGVDKNTATPIIIDENIITIDENTIFEPVPSLRRYVVISEEGIDIAELEFELERDTTNDTSDSTAYIPNRIADVAHAKKANNRITIYMLSNEEATELSKDPRILDVEIVIDNPYELFAKNTDVHFIMGGIPSTKHHYFTHSKNWGLRRHVLNSVDRGLWYSGYSTWYDGAIRDEEYALDGTGVDIVIMDNGMVDHSEFQDADGNSRYIQFDWNQIIDGCMPSNYYTEDFYDDITFSDKGHGTHCAGIAAGKTFGWAKNAHIYNVQLIGGANNQGPKITYPDYYDLIRIWHERKNDPNDSLYTGRPTIVNQSFGMQAPMGHYGHADYSKKHQFFMQNIAYKGVEDPNFLKQARQGLPPNWEGSGNEGEHLDPTYPWNNEMWPHKYSVCGGYLEHGNQNNWAITEQQQLTDAGVICCKAAGNYSQFMVGPPGTPYYDERWDSYFITAEDASGTYVTWDDGTPGGYTGINYGHAAFSKRYFCRPSPPWSNDTIMVANLSDYLKHPEWDEHMNNTSVRGPRVDVCAAGTGIWSSTSFAFWYATKLHESALNPGPIPEYGYYEGQGETPTADPNADYQVKFTGTSMSAPQITGMGALWLQMNPKGTAQQFKDFLTEHAKTGLFRSGPETLEAERFGPYWYRNSDYSKDPTEAPVGFTWYPGPTYGQPDRIAYWPYSGFKPWDITASEGSADKLYDPITMTYSNN